jgi:hypothetical protein
MFWAPQFKAQQKNECWSCPAGCMSINVNRLVCTVLAILCCAIYWVSSIRSAFAASSDLKVPSQTVPIQSARFRAGPLNGPVCGGGALGTHPPGSGPPHVPGRKGVGGFGGLGMPKLNDCSGIVGLVASRAFLSFEASVVSQSPYIIQRACPPKFLTSRPPVGRTGATTVPSGFRNQSRCVQ